MQRAKLISRVALIILKKLEVSWRLAQWKVKLETGDELTFCMAPKQILSVFQVKKDFFNSIKIRAENDLNSGAILLKNVKKEFKKIKNISLAAFIDREIPRDLKPTQNKISIEV